MRTGKGKPAGPGRGHRFRPLDPLFAEEPEPPAARRIEYLWETARFDELEEEADEWMPPPVFFRKTGQLERRRDLMALRKPPQKETAPYRKPPQRSETA